MNGLILRLAGPLQAWGEHSTFAQRDTTAFPTRSGLTGLLASAEGRPRDAELGDYEHLELVVRIDRPGTHLTDFHTVGGGNLRTQTVRTAAGTRRPEGKSTLVLHRHYLADAVFTVGVQARDAEGAACLARITTALARPAWAPYLGRRSCVPDLPLLLHTDVEDVEDELRARTPLSRLKPGTPEHPPLIDFLHERPPHDTDPDLSTYELLDIPDSFAPLDRRYRLRRLYRSRHPVTAPSYSPGRDRHLHDYAMAQRTAR